jgi:hypothetical protein
MGQFGIHAVEGADSVIGRCYRGPLKLGVVFTSFEDESGTMHSVRLKITRIEAYRRELDELDEALTARLHLRGDGLEIVHAKGALHAPD